METISKTFCTIVAVAGVLSAAFSCAKQLAPIDPNAPTGEGELVDVVFTLSEDDIVLTKVTSVSSSDETKVNRYTVFAFDTESNWHTYATSVDGSNVTLQVRADRNYSCYALVNYPASGAGALSPSGITSASQLQAKVGYLADMSKSSLLMYGTETVSVPAMDFDPEDDPSTITPVTRTIHVSRLVSRIDIPSVRVDFSAKPHLAARTFVLKHIYVINTYLTSRYGSDYAYGDLSNDVTAWYNPGGWHRTGVPSAAVDALVADRDINATLTSGSPHSVMHSFYVFPNAMPKTSDEHQMGTWRKRCTRIVLEATMDGTTMYYQVDVPAMERNRIYSTTDQVVITDMGSTDPEVVDMMSSTIDVNFTVSASGWEEPVNVVENS